MNSFRNRVTLFSFILTVLVIYVHAAYPDMAALQADSSLKAAYYIENLLSSMIGSVAVPGFFLLSGYLFFRDKWEGPGFFITKWRRRLKSLVLPFAVWNLLYFIVYLIAGRAELSPGEIVSALIDYKYNPVFWYLKQLIILIILTPLIWLFIRKRTPCVMAVALTYILAVFYDKLPLHVVNEDALFYFTFGAASSVWLKGKVEGSDEIVAPVRTRRDFYMMYILRGTEGVALIVSGGIFLIAQYVIYFIAIGRYAVLALLIASRVAGAVFLYYLSGVLITALVLRDLKLSSTSFRALKRYRAHTLGDHSMPWYMHYNFFIYAAHYLVIRALRVALGLIGAPLILSETAGYLLMPVAALLICLAAGRLIKRFLNPLYLILTGWR